MKRAATLASLGLAVVLGSFAFSPTPAAGQDAAEIQTTLDVYAQALSTCDEAALGACTTAPFHERLRVRLTPCTSGQLGSFRRVDLLSQLETGLVQGTLLWTQPDGVEETVTVTVKRVGTQWVVSGGEVP